MLKNLRRIQIEWGDCDAAGTVFFPRYLEYGDACTNALFQRAGLRKEKMLKTYQVTGIPMVDVRAHFLIPSGFGDKVVYETYIHEWGRSSFVVHHKVFRPGGKLCLEIFEKRVWVIRVSERPIAFRGVPIPEEVKKRFAGAAPAGHGEPQRRGKASKSR